MGREVGGGFRNGNLYTPVADSCWCMAKPIQYCKVKKKKKKIKKKDSKAKAHLKRESDHQHCISSGLLTMHPMRHDFLFKVTWCTFCSLNQVSYAWHTAELAANSEIAFKSWMQLCWPSKSRLHIKETFLFFRK